MLKMVEQDSNRAEWALRERVKELTCLYGIVRVTQGIGVRLDDALQAIVELLPPAWQYPSAACAAITVSGRTYATRLLCDGPHRQTAEIVVAGISRGVVEVCYTQDVPKIGGSAFLPEEQSLIDMVALEVVMLVEHCEAEERNVKLQEQLRHADRLATIGQLAAGVAHELNEPLANILGFAQLAQKASPLPKQVSADMQRIVENCLHAREVIQKLLMFARQMPPRITRVQLNNIVSEGMYFLDARCAKAGIEVVRRLDPTLPAIDADPSQLHQVLVNLAVNSIQAMPQGGTLTLETRAEGDWVRLVVQDTGAGMTAAVRQNIFTPFFTTKDVNEGTGLGLAVVHGIVTSHGGTIDVRSEAGCGARFEIRLPVKGESEGEAS